MKAKLALISGLVLSGILQAAVPVTDGLVCHLDAGTLSAGPVATWSDLSGLTGNDAVQIDGARQPIYVAASEAFANRPVVRFDGVDDFLDLNENMINVGSFTAMIVGQFTNAPGTGNHFMIAGQTGGDNRLRIGWDQVGNVLTYRVGNSANLPSWSPAADNDPHVFAVNSAMTAYIDGIALGTSTNTSELTPDALNLGSFNLGQNQFFQGDMAEVIIYNRALTETEMEQVGIYLSNKYPTIETADRNLPHDPSPADEAVGILPDAVLTWNAALDPANLAQVNAAVKKHYVWMSSGDPEDPNLMLAATIDITDYSDITADSFFDPTPDLVYDGTYFWMIEEAVDNGLGGTYPAGDPNNLVSPVWTFSTIGTVPTITLQPVSVKVDAGQTAVFTLEYNSASSAFVTWYKDGTPLTAGGNVTIDSDATSGTLTIANVSDADEADYYAIVSNIGGGDSEPTQTAGLAIKQHLAWYRFEQNLDDAEGINHADVVGPMQYAAGRVTADGQAYAADPNGSPYGLLTTEAYPKAGFGNGLEEFTYSCWVKLGASEGGVIIGDLNTDANTAIRFSVNGVENDISTYLRQEGGQAVTAYMPALSRDSQWHHVAVTYDGAQMVIFVDGLSKATASGTVTDFTSWEFPMTILAINGRGTIDQRFNGQIDDLQILNYALTTDQVAQEYLGVTGGWICDPERPALSYDFDDNCRVDLGDLAIFAAEWLKSNRIYAQ